MRAILVPVDPAQPITVTDVGSGFPDLARAVGGPCEYIERFRCPLTPEHHLVGVVDEDGLYNGQPANPRAHPLYPRPGYNLHGTVLVMAEGVIDGDIDFLDLPDPDGALAVVKALLGES